MATPHAYQSDTLDLTGLRAAAAEQGISLPPVFPIDGKIHRFAANGDASDTAGWVVVREVGDTIVASAGDWRTGARLNWTSARPDEVSLQRRQEIESALAALREQEQADREARHREAAAKAEKMWGLSVEADPEHPYLCKKGVAPNGLHQDANATLFVPVVSAEDNELRGLQRINPEGEKRFVPGTKVAGGMCPLGTLEGAERIHICEGFATAASVRESLPDTPAVIAFNAGNLLAVAKTLRARFPKAQLVVCADDDRKTSGNPGMTKAREAALAVNGLLAVPEFGSERGDRDTDFNDLHSRKGVLAVRECLERAVPMGKMPTLQQISMEELYNAKLSPREIVPGLIYADVRIWSAAGGAGKTTLLLREAMLLALGREIYGRRPIRAGTTVLVSREDPRHLLVARLRELIAAEELSPEETRAVLERVHILDLSDVQFRLCETVKDVVIPHAHNIEMLCQTLAGIEVDRLSFDPLVSFGVGESRVNDNEQGLIEAMRMLRNRLNCCVEAIHHVGKANAREGATDQYAARGGSALPDGARMVATMRNLNAQDWQRSTGTALAEGESGIQLALPKLSYARPQPDIFIRRIGYHFLMVEIAPEQSPEERLQRNVQIVEERLRRDAKQGHMYSQKQLEGMQAELFPQIGTRAALRVAIARLESDGAVRVEGKGPKQKLVPVPRERAEAE